MPSGDEIQRYLTAAWRLMLGRSDAVRLLDLSADGFWNSFFAIVVAAPVLVVGWVSAVNGLDDQPAGLPGRIGLLVVFALIDLATWIVPLVVLAFVLRPLGLGDRFVPYVVASNWGSVIAAWLSLPAVLMSMVLGSRHDAAATVGLLLFIVSLVLSWRLTNSVVNRGAGAATAVFAIALGVGLATLFLLRAQFGLDLPQSSG